MFEITIRCTSIIVGNGKLALDLLTPLFNMLTYEDEYVEETKTLGFLYDEQSDRIFLHKGVDLEYVVKLLGGLNECKIVYDDKYTGENMSYEFEEVIAPRSDEQSDVIDFVCGRNGHSNNINEHQLFLVLGTGKGKAQPYSSKIPVPDSETGFVNMGDLKIGDLVFDVHGEPTKILDIFEQGEQDVYQITLADNRTVFCTKEHLWTVFDVRQNKMMTITLDEMISSYKILTTMQGNRKPFRLRYKIPICDSVDYIKKPVPIDPWVLGCFIGNGCCREKPLTISSGNTEIPNRIASICGFDVKRSSLNNYSYVFYKNGSPVHTKDFFKDIPEIINAYSYEKHIPDKYLYNTSAIRLKLLQGLMDTDGSIAENDGRFHILYSSTSEKLLKQIILILNSFGFGGTICQDSRKEKYKSGFCGNIIFRVPNFVKHKFFTLSYKHDIALKAINKSQQNYYNGILIKDIKKLDRREQCRCIMVDNPEHLYLTDDYIVTHNTFCSGYGIGEYGKKALIIMHRDSLRSQWLESLYKMNGFTSSYVHEIDSAEELYDIANGTYNGDYDIYLMTHATFRAGMKRIGTLEKAMNITKNLGIGIKVIDEAHLEFKDTILMDMVFNVYRNVYLTATDGRSSKEENSIFRHVFANACYYKQSDFVGDDNRPKKWVNYYGIEVNTNCPKNLYKYKVVGFKSMTPSSYGKWVIQRDKNKTHFKCCTEIIHNMFMEDQYAKVLVFMPLIDLCEEFAYHLNMALQKDPSFPYDVDVRTVNSKNSSKQNERNKSADVIVTTIGSCGTGTDIPGITGIVSCSPYVSQISAKQIFGRIRYCGKIGSYYDIYDSSVPMDRYWYQSRSKTLKRLALNVKELKWVDDNPENTKEE